MSISTTEVFDEETKVSKFLVTVNTQRHPSGGRGQMGVQDERDRAVSVRWTTTGAGCATWTRAPGEELVDNIAVQWNVERGPTRGAMHYHFIVTVRHRTRLLLSYPALRATFAPRLAEALNVDNKLHILSSTWAAPTPRTTLRSECPPLTTAPSGRRRASGPSPTP